METFSATPGTTGTASAIIKPGDTMMISRVTGLRPW
jgi:hypothetical protein